MSLIPSGSYSAPGVNYWIPVGGEIPPNLTNNFSTIFTSTLTTSTIRTAKDGYISTPFINVSSINLYGINGVPYVNGGGTNIYNELFTSSIRASTVNTGSFGGVSTGQLIVSSILGVKPTLDISSGTSVRFTTPLVNFSGGIAVGGSESVGGNITIAGNASVTQDLTSRSTITNTLTAASYLAITNLSSINNLPYIANPALLSISTFSTFAVSSLTVHQIKFNGDSVALGLAAGTINPGEDAIAIGYAAGQSSSGLHSIAIGAGAGYQQSGQRSVAIGYNAGAAGIGNSTIVISAQGAVLNGNTIASLYISPIRQITAAGLSTMSYNPVSKEITYGQTPASGLTSSIQINNNGILGSVADLSYNPTTNALNVSSLNSSAVINGSSMNLTGNLAVNGSLTVPSLTLNTLTVLQTTQASTISATKIGTSTINVNGYIGGVSYTNSQIDTNVNVGSLNYVTNPNVTIFPGTMTVGTGATYANAINMTTGPTVLGVGGMSFSGLGNKTETFAGTNTITGGGSFNVTTVGGVNITTAALTTINSATGVSILGGGGVAVTGGLGVVITGGVGLGVLAGAGISIGTSGVAGGGLTSYGGDLNIYAGLGNLNGNAYITNNVFASTLKANHYVSTPEVIANLMYSKSTSGLAISTLSSINGVPWPLPGAMVSDKYSTLYTSSIVASTVTISRFGFVSTPLVVVSSIYYTTSSITIGQKALGNNGVAIGYLANANEQTIAIGAAAGQVSGANINSLCIGANSGTYYQGCNSVALGFYSGFKNQGANAIAIGAWAGYGEDSIGQTPQAASTIILNATNVGLNGVAGQKASFYVAPIRKAAATNLSTIYYNPSSFEITYGPASGGSGDLISTFVNLYASSFIASTITTSSITVPALTSVSSINGVAYQTNPALVSTFFKLYASSFTASTITTSNITVPSLTSVSSINGVAWPPALVSTFFKLYASSITASTITSSTINVPALQSVSSINGVEYQTPFLVSSFRNLFTSSFVASTIVANASVSTVNLDVTYINMAYNPTASVVLGYGAGSALHQSTQTVSIGYGTGLRQGNNSVALGATAANTGQRSYATALGSGAGFQDQGQNSIAIGYRAGETSQHASSIIINATGNVLNSISTQSFYVAPIRSDPTLNLSTMSYNTTTNEVTYGPPITSAISSFDNLYTSSLTASTITTTDNTGYISTATLSTDKILMGKGDLYNIAIGSTVQSTIATSRSVAIGFAAGATGQKSHSVAIGEQTGAINLGASFVAIGWQAGYSNAPTGRTNSVAIGIQAAMSNQGSECVALGDQAGKESQGDFSIAIGNLAGISSQATLAVAIGRNAGAYSQQTYAVALGSAAGYSNQGGTSIAIGRLAGFSAQANSTIILSALGSTISGIPGQTNSFYVTPIRNDVTAGLSTLHYNASSFEITYGPSAGGSETISSFRNLYTSSFTTSTIFTAADGYISTQTLKAQVIKAYDTTSFYVSVDTLSATHINQDGFSVSIGQDAGAGSAEQYRVAAGYRSGFSDQSLQAVAIGAYAGYLSQSTSAIAVGAASGNDTQGEYAIALGYRAGNAYQGANSIAIGQGAGSLNQAQSTIVINASGTDYSGIGGQQGSLFITPIRYAAVTTQSNLYYNPDTFEITYAPGGGASISSFNQLYTSSIFTSSITAIDMYVSSIPGVDSISGQLSKFSTIHGDNITASTLSVTGNAYISSLSATTISTLIFTTSTLNTSSIVSYDMQTLYLSTSFVTGISTMDAASISSINISTIDLKAVAISTVNLQATTTDLSTIQTSKILGGDISAYYLFVSSISSFSQTVSSIFAGKVVASSFSTVVNGGINTFYLSTTNAYISHLTSDNISTIAIDNVSTIQTSSITASYGYISSIYTGQINSLSSINNVPYVSFSGFISSFDQLFTSSMSVSSLTVNEFGTLYTQRISSLSTVNDQPYLAYPGLQSTISSFSDLQTSTITLSTIITSSDGFRISTIRGDTTTTLSTLSYNLDTSEVTYGGGIILPKIYYQTDPWVASNSQFSIPGPSGGGSIGFDQATSLYMSNLLLNQSNLNYSLASMAVMENTIDSQADIVMGIFQDGVFVGISTIISIAGVVEIKQILTNNYGGIIYGNSNVIDVRMYNMTGNGGEVVVLTGSMNTLYNIT